MALILKDAKGNQIEFPTLYGYSIYYYPDAVQGEINTDISINLNLIDKTEDREIQVGDLIISNNGKLCRITSLSDSTVIILVNLGQANIQNELPWTTPEAEGWIDEPEEPEDENTKKAREKNNSDVFQNLDKKLVLLSAKVYKLNGPITYGPGTLLIGAGMNKTIIEQPEDKGTDLLVFENATGSGLRDLTLRGAYSWSATEYEESSVVDKALLKICCIKNSKNMNEADLINNRNQHTTFSNLSIQKAWHNGLYIKGQRSYFNDAEYEENGMSEEDEAYGYNWVLQMHNIRCQSARLYTMIDESCDNRYSQFYISGGEIGGLLLYNASSNTYSDFKCDGESGSAVSISDLNPLNGALLIAKNCALLNFSNFDLQTTKYCGAKFTGCRGMRFSGDINNCGLVRDTDTEQKNYESRGLELNKCRESSFNIAFGKVNHPQKYNVVIDDECVNCDCNTQETYKTENINNSPASCFIRNSSAMAGNYAGVLNLNKPLINYMPLNTWKATNGTEFDIELEDFSTNHSKLGTISLEPECITIQSNNATMGITKAITGLQAGDLYLIGCTISTEQQPPDENTRTLNEGERIWLTIGTYDGTNIPQTILNNPSDFDAFLTKQFIYSVVRIRTDSIRASLFAKTEGKQLQVRKLTCIRLADLPGMTYPSSKSLDSLIQNLSSDTIESNVDYSVGFEEVFDLVKDLNTFHQNFITPQMYGAKGDGVTDDTDAVERCVKENTNIYFPKGKYLMRRPLIISRVNMILMGDGGLTNSDAEDALNSSTTLIFDNCDGLVFKNGLEGNWLNQQTRFFTMKGINLVGTEATKSFDDLMESEDYESICCAIRVDSTSLFKFQVENCMIKNFHVGITDNFGEVTSVIYNGSFKHMYIVNTEYAIHLGWTHSQGYGHFGIRFEDLYIDGGKLRMSEGNYNFYQCNFGIYNVAQFDFFYAFKGTWEACNFECDVNVVPVKALTRYDWSEEGIGGTFSTQDCNWLFNFIGVHNFLNCDFAAQGYAPLTFFNIKEPNAPRAITFTNCRSGVVNRKKGETRTNSTVTSYKWVNDWGSAVTITYPNDIYKNSNYLPAGSKIFIGDENASSNVAEWNYNVKDMTTIAQPTIWQEINKEDILKYSKKFIFLNCVDMDILNLVPLILSSDGTFKRIVFNEDGTVTWENVPS